MIKMSKNLCLNPLFHKYKKRNMKWSQFNKKRTNKKCSQSMQRVHWYNRFNKKTNWNNQICQTQIWSNHQVSLIILLHFSKDLNNLEYSNDYDLNDRLSENSNNKKLEKID